MYTCVLSGMRSSGGVEDGPDEGDRATPRKDKHKPDDDDEEVAEPESGRLADKYLTLIDPKAKPMSPSAFYQWKKKFGADVMRCLEDCGNDKKQKKDPLLLCQALYDKLTKKEGVEDLNFPGAKEALEKDVAKVKALSQKCIQWKQTGQLEYLQEDLYLEINSVRRKHSKDK